MKKDAAPGDECDSSFFYRMKDVALLQLPKRGTVDF